MAAPTTALIIAGHFDFPEARAVKSALEAAELT
jgi:hypothetical protein